MIYSTEPKCRKHVEGYGFLSFSRKIGDKYSKRNNKYCKKKQKKAKKKQKQNKKQE